MKKIIALLLCGMMLNMTALALEEATVEHIKLPKKLAKKTPTDIVNTTDTLYSVLEYNTLELTFAQDFSGKDAHVGDEVTFLLKNGAVTKEGSELLPPSTKVVAKISNIEKPKSFNRSGKVTLCFDTVVLPTGQRIPLEAKLYSKRTVSPVTASARSQ